MSYPDEGTRAFPRMVLVTAACVAALVVPFLLVSRLAGGPTQVYAVAFGTVCLGLEVFMAYRQYVRYLKWLTLALFAYVGVVLSVDVPWGEVVAGITLPRMDLSAAAVMLVVAIFGTTISPYLFFWQAAQEVEEAASAASGGKRANAASIGRQLRRIEFDTIAGMTFSNLIALAIIISAAATLHPAGITHRHRQISLIRQSPIQPLSEQGGGAIINRAVPTDHRRHARSHQRCRQ